MIKCLVIQTAYSTSIFSSPSTNLVVIKSRLLVIMEYHLNGPTKIFDSCSTSVHVQNVILFHPHVRFF